MKDLKTERPVRGLLLSVSRHSLVEAGDFRDTFQQSQAIFGTLLSTFMKCPNTSSVQAGDFRDTLQQRQAIFGTLSSRGRRFSGHFPVEAGGFHRLRILRQLHLNILRQNYFLDFYGYSKSFSRISVLWSQMFASYPYKLTILLLLQTGISTWYAIFLYVSLP